MNKEISIKQGLLHELNLKFPEERKKPYKNQDPEFQAQRNVILGDHAFLMRRQSRRITFSGK